MDINHQQIILKLRTFLFVLILTQFISVSHAKIAQEIKAQITIEQLYRELNKTPTQNMANRLELISQYFIGKPYILGALGEGENARYDQSPRYRDDGFDCETFVDTVLAIALSSNFKTFEQCIDHIRYRHGLVDFTTRNHFTDLDWNKNNQQQGFLIDITEKITNNAQQPVFLMAKAIINKPSWYQHMKSSSIKLNRNKKEQSKRLLELQQKGNQLTVQQTTIPYIPLSALFDQQGKANQAIFSQIPNGAIIEIIRPNWDLREQIGTCLNVSHLGFAFWNKRQLIFRQASSEYHKVVDVSLVEYLKKARSSPTIKGINIQSILQEPATCG